VAVLLHIAFAGCAVPRRNFKRFWAIFLPDFIEKTAYISHFTVNFRPKKTLKTVFNRLFLKNTKKYGRFIILNKNNKVTILITF